MFIPRPVTIQLTHVELFALDGSLTESYYALVISHVVRLEKRCETLDSLLVAGAPENIFGTLRAWQETDPNLAVHLREMLAALSHEGCFVNGNFVTPHALKNVS
jgi:hypothetical protein